MRPLPPPGSRPTPGPPVLVPYDPAWPTRFEAYRDELLEVRGVGEKKAADLGETFLEFIAAQAKGRVRP